MVEPHIKIDGLYLQENHGDRKMNDCQVCGQDFESNEDLQTHIKEHPEYDQQNFLCAKCGKRYVYFLGSGLG